ncbi:MAG: ABC transporter substrate-binding protein [Lachnospiraceae bacterium]|nr:ABC transporter substrate-binding protein [Lachnospiraceae bacterium]
MKKYLAILCMCIFLAGCSNQAKESAYETSDERLNKVSGLELEYASQFLVDYYEEDYIHIKTADNTDYVLVPENKAENKLGLENPVFIHKPVNNIYLAATSAMDLFIAIDGLSSIKACSTKGKDYAMQEAREAIDSGLITYVGKYSAPDYELLLDKKCTLAIESTMISHSPKIKEQIENIGIPVFVERSSYEENPIGRLEWIKLYGVLLGKEIEAEAFFNEELKKIDALKLLTEKESTPKVAFFSISSNGYVTVRKPHDYICKMIEMAGGEYALDSLEVAEENAMSTMNIGMEEFYKLARDADILIYNGTIDGGVKSLDEFLNKSDLLKDFKAVKDGNVFSTNVNMFQESSKIVENIYEFYLVINGDEDKLSDLNYLMKLK